MQKIMKDQILTGEVGETYVAHQLALRGIVAVRMPKVFQSDIQTAGGVRIEVKTAHLQETRKKFMTNTGEKESIAMRWQFRNQPKDGKPRERNCDFYVLVGLAENSYDVKRVYVVPSGEIGGAEQIAITESTDSSRSKLYKYWDKWELITDSTTTV